MKPRSLALVLVVFSCVASSGTPPTTPTTPTSPAELRQQPMQVQQLPANLMALNRPAPWQSVEQAKLQYNVFRQYAPASLAPQFDRPVTNNEYRNLVSQRAASFRSGNQALRLAVNANVIIDVGAMRADDAGTVALVDLERSTGVLESLRADVQLQKALKLSFDPSKSYVIPTLSSVFSKEGGARSAYVGGESLTVNVAAKDHSRLTVLRMEDGRWKVLSDSLRSTVTIESPQVLREKLARTGEPEFYRGYNVVGTVTVPADIRWISMSAFEEARRQKAAARTSPAPPGTPSPPKPPESTPLPTPPPKPPSYTGYGSSPICRRHCSAGECFGCCAAAMAAEQASVFSTSLACHAASDLCPWCHIGCAILTASLSAWIPIHDTQCVTTCPMGRETTVSSGNPYHCPVH